MSALNSSARLSDVCHFQNGGTPSKSIERFFTGDIPWITGADLVGPIALQARSFITEEAIASSATNQVPAGTVLLVTRTSIGKVAIAGMSLCFSQDITALTPDAKKLSAEYLVHFLRTKHEHFTKHARGATIQGITREVVADLEIPLPPLEEQRRIAAILDQAETLRTQRRQALAHLDTLTQSLFLDMFGDPASNPMAWDIRKVEQLADQVTDGEHLTPKREPAGIKLLSARNVRDGFIDFKNVDFVGQAEHERIKKRCNPVRGDVLISCSGSIGRVASVETDEPFSLVRSVAMIRPKTDVIYTKFLEYYLRTPAMNAYMIRRANASSQANLFQGPIREMLVLVPPLALQQTFATRIQAIEALKATHRAALAQLDALFASLQQRAFSGELTRTDSATVSTRTKPDLSALCTLDVKKMLEAMIYVAKRIPGHDFYKSLKALYAGDRQHLEHHGCLIYGETYEALEHGPVPKAAYALTKQLEEAASSNLFADDALSIPLRRIGNQLIPARDADFGLLSAAERKSLDWAIQYFAPMRFGETKTATHDSAYLATAPNAPLAIEAIIRTLPEAAQRRFFA